MRRPCPDCGGRLIPAGTTVTARGTERRSGCRDCGALITGHRTEDHGWPWTMWG